MSAATVGSRVPRDRTILIAGTGTSPAVLTETEFEEGLTG